MLALSDIAKFQSILASDKDPFLCHLSKVLMVPKGLGLDGVHTYDASTWQVGSVGLLQTQCQLWVHIKYQVK